MKKFLAALPWLAAVVAALIVAPRAAHAQIVTFNTITAYNGVEDYGFTNSSGPLVQTFQNVAELNNLTYQFVSNGSDTVDQTIQAYLVQWDTNTFAPKTTFTTEAIAGSPGSDFQINEPSTPFSTFTVPPTAGDSYGSWQSQSLSGGGTYPGFQVTLTLNQVLDPSLTYAIILFDTSVGAGGGTGLALPGVITSTNSFAGYGTGMVDADPVTTLSAMQNDSNSNATNPITGPSHGAQAGDETFGFSQIQLVPGINIVPVPEPRTAAAILCALFVAGLVGRQILLRRREDAATFSALAV